MYSESVRLGEKVALVEMRTRPTFKFFLDLDILHEEQLNDHTIIGACNVCRTIFNESDTVVMCTTEPKTKNGMIKTGIHLHWDTIVHEKDVPDIVDKLILKLDNEYPMYDWKKYIDMSVYRGGGLRMKWAHKYENETYTAPYFPLMEIGPTMREINTGISSEILQQVSIRDTGATPMSFQQKMEGGFTCDQQKNRTEASSDLEQWIRNTLEGQQDAVINGMFIHDTCALVSTYSKYCENLERNHNSNHVFFHIDFKTNQIYQRCFCECQTTQGRKQGMCQDFSGKKHRIPIHLIIKYKPDKMPCLIGNQNDRIAAQFFKQTTKTKL